MCLAQDGGYFTVGGHNTAHHDPSGIIHYTPYFEEYSQYRVYINKIKVNGKDIGLKPAVLNHGEGAFFDSGTTLTHVPSQTYEAINEHLHSFCESDSNNCAQGARSKKEVFCWIYHPKKYPTTKDFFDTFPTFKFYFGQDGDAEYEWRPEDYMYQKEDLPEYCIGLARYDRETILGATFMKNHDVLFDKSNKRIGFVRSNCSADNIEVSSNSEENNEVTYPQDGSSSEIENGQINEIETPPKNYWNETTIVIVISVAVAVILTSILLYIKYRKRNVYKNMGTDPEISGSNVVKESSFDSKDLESPKQTNNKESQGSPNTENPIVEVISEDRPTING